MASPNGQVSAPPARPTPAAPGGARSGMMSTQIFGSGPHPNPAAGPSAPEPVPNATQTFGAVPPPPSIPPVGTTRAGGAVPPGATAPGNATRTFGAVPAPGATSPGNATQTFGAVSAPGATSPGNATRTFGAVPAPGATAPGNATRTFGAVSPRSAAPGSATQTFGAVSAQGATSPGNATRTFGAVPAPGATNATQTFGAVPAPGATSPSSATQTFGAVPAQGSTAPDNLPQTLGAVPAREAPAPTGKTQVFGAVTASPPEPAVTSLSGSPSSRPPSSIGTTQVFGAVPSEPSRGAAEQGPGIGRTALFGAAAPAPGQGPGLQLPPEPPLPMTSEASRSFGPAAQGDEPLSGTGATVRRPPVELPPELLAAGREPVGEGVDPGQPKRERLLIMLVAAAGLVLTAVLAYPAWRDRDADMPVAAVEDKDRAAALLRRDDPASREQAIQRLRALNVTHPRYTEAQAELVVALSLRLSDLQADSERLRMQGDRLNRQKADAQELRDPVERDLRVAAVEKELADLAAEAAPLLNESGTLRKELDAQVAVLANPPEVEPAPALVARVKARAIHASVTVAPDALALAERLRGVEGSSKAWSTLSRAEYALNSGSPPDSLAEIAKELEALRKEDRTLLRAYVLGARVAMRLNDSSTARSLLDDALALNPNHQLASKLLSQIDTDARRP